QQFHFLLMSTEIPTIEHCARLIIQRGDLPWAFVQDMARQCWDEGRHAKACIQHIIASGYNVGDFPVELNLWRAPSDQPLPLARAVHQRIGERIGVDAAVWASMNAAASGASDTARTFDFIYRDEVLHVRFGNYWLRYMGIDMAAIDNLANIARDRVGLSGQG